MKKVVTIILVLMLCLGVANAFAADFDLTVSHIVDESNSWHLASVYFKEQLEARSDRRISVTVYPNSQLGSEIDSINSALTGGGVDIVITGESMMTYVPELGILGVPYLMTSPEHVELVAGGEIGDKIEELMLMGGTGLRGLAYFVRGPRNVTANKEIHAPSDMQGLLIRTPSSTITVSTFESFGAKPTPMAFAELFTALQSGTVQAQENPLAMIKSGNLYEVQKYLVRTEHLRTWVYFAMAESTYQSMPEDLRRLVDEVSAETRAYEHELFLAAEESLEDELKAAGMTFIEDVDQAAFANLANEAMTSLMEGEYSYLKPLYDEIKAIEPAAE